MNSIRTSSPSELAIMISARRPQKTYGGMTESQAREITDRMAANPEKYA